MENPGYLNFYKNELKSSLQIIEEKIKTRQNPKLNPYNLSIQIFKLIKDYKISKNRTEIHDRIRKFHDYYGWMAKGNTRQLGLCSGAFYRTFNFLSIKPEDRDGRKVAKHLPIGVHIEHSIPVKTIGDLLITEINNDSSAQDVFNIIISYSICTAFSRHDEDNSIRYKYNHEHPDIRIENYSSGNLPRLENIKPFSRYKSDLIIYSMQTGLIVDKNTSLKELQYSWINRNIFNWRFIEKNYK